MVLYVAHTFVVESFHNGHANHFRKEYLPSSLRKFRMAGSLHVVCRREWEDPQPLLAGLLFRQNCKSVTDLLPLIYRDVIPSGSGTGGYGNATTRTCIRITPNSSAMSTCDWRSCNRATFWVPGKGKRACIAALPDQCMTDRLCLRSSLRLVSRGLRSNYLAKVRTISPFHTWPLSCSPIALSSR